MHTLFLQHSPIQLPKSTYSLIVLYCYNHMYRTLTNPKFFCCLPHGGIAFDNVICNFNCPLFDIFFHEKTPAILVFTLYARVFPCMTFSAPECLSDSDTLVFFICYRYLAFGTAIFRNQTNLPASIRFPYCTMN